MKNECIFCLNYLLYFNPKKDSCYVGIERRINTLSLGTLILNYFLDPLEFILYKIFQTAYCSTL